MSAPTSADQRAHQKYQRKLFVAGVIPAKNRGTGESVGTHTRPDDGHERMSGAASEIGEGGSAGYPSEARGPEERILRESQTPGLKLDKQALNPTEIPPWIRQALDRYAADHRPAGGFLTAVLENNLALAVLLADENSLKALKLITRYLLNHTPAESRGSKKKVAAWLVVGEPHP